MGDVAPVDATNAGQCRTDPVGGVVSRVEVVTSDQDENGHGELSVRPLRDGQRFSLRWVLLHLIEETARHAGHADFLREAIDGTVGE